MKNRIALACIALLSLMSLSLPALAETSPGSAAPDFAATDALSGKSIHLTDFKGKLVVLEWTNPECPFVHKFYSVGAMQQLQQNAEKHGVVWISINSSAEGKEGYFKTDAEAQAWVADQKGNANYYIRDTHGDIGKLYGAKTTPHMFVIDKTGTLAYMGAIDDMATADTADIATAKNYVTAALKSLSAGQPVAVTQTRSYGCFVKY